MPAPSAYLTITSYPYSRVITQAEFNGGTYGNTTNEVWFRIDLAVSREVIGFYIERGGTYSPNWALYKSDGSTLVFAVNSSINPSWIYDVDDSESDPYYLKVTRRGGGSSDFDFTVHADTREILAEVNVGDVIVHDDGSGIPGAVLDPATGEVRGYIDIPGSEHGAEVVDGTTVWYDRFGDYGDTGSFAIFDPTFQYVVSTTQVFNDPPSIAASESEVFALESTNGEIYSINLTTGATTLVATVAHPATTSIGVNAEGTILYYVDASGFINFDPPPSDNVIHAWDLIDDSALPDLYTVSDISSDFGGLAVTPNFWSGEILVLPDGSIVTWSQNDDAGHDILLHIDSDGTLLQSYTYTHPPSGRRINHIAYINNGSESIAVWFYLDNSDKTGIITEVLLSDGSESNTIDLEQFASGTSLVTDSDDPFGISSSCTFLIAGARASLSLTVSEICCPCDCPTPKGPKEPLPSHTGQILPPVFPDDWTPQCEGGGAVPTALDASDPESWVQ